MPPITLLLGNSDLLRFEKHWSRQVTDVELNRKLKLFKYFSLSRLVSESLGLGVKRKKRELLLKQTGNPQTKGKSICIKLALFWNGKKLIIP